MCLATTISASIMATGHTKPCKCGLKITLSILDDVLLHAEAMLYTTASYFSHASVGWRSHSQYWMMFYYMQGPYTQQPHTSALSLVKRGDPKYDAHILYWRSGRYKATSFTSFTGLKFTLWTLAVFQRLPSSRSKYPNIGVTENAKLSSSCHSSGSYIYLCKSHFINTRAHVQQHEV